MFYVKVTTPTTNLGSRAGWYPDPLVPRAFGDTQTVPGLGEPRPHHAVLHPRARALRHAGRRPTRPRSQVERAARHVDLPFSLHVWGFGWTRISTRSAFAMSQDNLERSLPRNFNFNGENKATVLRNFYTVMKQHGISPTIVHYLPKVTDSSGNLQEARAWADKVAPFLDEDRGRRRAAGQPAAAPALVPVEPQPEPELGDHPQLPHRR